MKIVVVNINEIPVTDNHKKNSMIRSVINKYDC